jgi:hypothetical protein
VPPEEAFPEQRSRSGRFAVQYVRWYTKDYSSPVSWTPSYARISGVLDSADELLALLIRLHSFSRYGLRVAMSVMDTAFDEG